MVCRLLDIHKCMKCAENRREGRTTKASAVSILFHVISNQINSNASNTEFMDIWILQCYRLLDANDGHQWWRKHTVTVQWTLLIGPSQIDGFTNAIYIHLSNSTTVMDASVGWAGRRVSNWRRIVGMRVSIANRIPARFIVQMLVVFISFVLHK